MVTDDLITSSMLADIDACEESCYVFEEQFPDGATWERVKKEYYHGDDSRTEQDVAWFAANAPASVAALSWEERVRVCGGKRAYSRLLCVRCPADVPGATWDARMALVCGRDRAYVAQRCLALPDGGDWDARVALMETDRDLTTLVCLCPLDVEGASIEARHALRVIVRSGQAAGSARDGLITAECLARVHVDPRTVEVFDRIFPQGATWHEVVAGYRYANGNATGPVYTAKHLRTLAIDCPALPHAPTWRERVAQVSKAIPNAQPANHALAHLAMFCPALGELDTWEARKALVPRGKWRNLARYCPSDVDNKTYAERVREMELEESDE